MKRSVLFAALWASVTAGVSLIAACYPDNCSGQVVTYGKNEGEGRMIDQDTWESSPQVGKWLWFGAARFYFFEVPAWGDRVPSEVYAYVSPAEDPNVYTPGRATNFTLAGGNLAEISSADRNKVNVRNGTCADYYVRVVVKLPPFPPAADAGINVIEVDAGTDASDAGADANDAEAGP